MIVEGKRRFTNKPFRLDELEEGEYIQLNNRWFARPPLSWAAIAVDGVTEHDDGTISLRNAVITGRYWWLVRGKWCSAPEFPEKLTKTSCSDAKPVLSLV